MNPDAATPSYVAMEDGYQWHTLVRRDDDKRFYWTKCQKPIDFDENWTASKRPAPPRMMCEGCTT